VRVQGLLIALVAVAAVGTPAVGVAADTNFARAGYAPRPVPAESAPYHDHVLEPRQERGLVDSSGVRMFSHPRFTDDQPMNHPVAQSQYGLSLLNSYRLTGDTWFLNRAVRQAQRLVETHIESRGAWWFPYPFDFDLRGDPDTLMEAPWYSAMAQGQVLSLFTRLAGVTGDARWSTAADSVFASLLLPVSDAEPWAVHTDADGFLWLEEYPRLPQPRSEQVLNGHLFALYGVWDYWRATGSAEAAALFDGSATTVAQYVPSEFRNPEWASDYSLFSDLPHERYHGIHVNQLHHLHALSGASVFANLGDTLHKDFSTPDQRGTLRFSEAKHTGVRFSAGNVTTRRTITLPRVSAAPFDKRRRITGQPGYWYHVTAGALANFWVQEVPNVRATVAPVSSVPYFMSRRVVLAAGTHTAHDGTKTKTITLSRPSSAPVGRIGWRNGRVAVLVSAGSLSGYWLPLTRISVLT
jgi:hypothetical protein